MKNPKEGLNGSISKRRKAMNVQLFNLPMDILSRILSELPINDAIRTSILSRKWKYVWCSHNNLTFNSATMRKHYFKSTTHYGNGILSDNEFITRVDKVLHQHSGLGVERMEVKFRLHNKHAYYIDRWVNFAIASKTKELNIHLFGWGKLLLPRDISYGRVTEEPYNLPSQLFDAGNGSYLQHLELTSVSLQLPADFNGFRNLKHLTLVDRMNLPRRLFKFNYLRHLNLELVIVGEEEREIDVLDYAQVLEVAPFIQKLELRMWMNCRHQPYRKEDGELRSRPRHQHGHLRLVRMSGFFGHKDQVELALHILGSSVNLEKMEITPRIERTGLLFEVGMGSYLMAS
ncbi:putative F-box/FBD/LRR-repeat protein At5g62970 isoform X1 [Panicum virgatum]|uniref:putative F-box/FBD/LRR-repeat protein At5g62970 isoform X1 n=1 Tax=Panicum virgatum TaxID=38727 RepID=UPI0019D5619E|nr:putative F-box/FBD/LRR-repeat protein At5g62970 isoform X1 [Panicum virgatum]XP_039831062.1 putative F-box/FBD/LRR-repeat protein At5g62970 isoform X1 [Panicum virgatum]